MVSQVADLITRWNEQPSAAQLLSQLTVYQFIRLNELELLELHFPPHLVLYQYQQPVSGDGAISLGETKNLVIGKMHPVLSLNSEFGYVFEFPNVKVYHGHGYFGVNRYANPEVMPAEVTLKGQYLNIFESESGVLCVGKIPGRLVERYGFKNQD